MPVPKRIIQTHRREDLGRAQRETWARHHPGWSIEFYDDAACRRFIETRTPEVLAAYDKLPLPVQKADLFRYVAVYELGGVYADVDTICCAPLASYLDLDAERLVCGIEMTPVDYALGAGRYAADFFVPFQLLQWTFAAPPRHPALALMIQRINFYVSQYAAEDLRAASAAAKFTLGLTGPWLFTTVVNEFLCGSRPDAAPVGVLPRMTWGSWPSEQEVPENGEAIKVRHLFEGGWQKSGG